MMFTIAIGSLLRILKSLSLHQSDEYQHPLMYFEDAAGIHLYKPIGYTVYHSLFKTGETVVDDTGYSMDMENFRVSMLTGALELQEMPKELKIEMSVT